MDKTATSESVDSADKKSSPQPEKGKQSAKRTRNAYQGNEKTGEKLDRHVSKRARAKYTPLLVTNVQTEMPMTVEVYTDFGAQACSQFLPAYDEAVSFLYDHVQKRMKPPSESAQRAEELGRLIDAHQRFSMSHEFMETRAKALEAKLANAGIDVEDALKKKAVSRTITVSNPHLVKYYEGIHKADRLVLILELAWIAGVIDVEDRGSDFWSLKRAIEREYNFIDRIYETCKNRSFWNPFPMFDGVKRRLEREQKANAEGDQEAGSQDQEATSEQTDDAGSAEKAPAKKAKPKSPAKKAEAKASTKATTSTKASAAKKATPSDKKSDESDSKKSDEHSGFDEGDVMQALG